MTTERLLNRAVRFYVVQRGDTLTSIGRRLGVPWYVLWNMNSIKNPDLIFPGELLRFEGSMS